MLSAHVLGLADDLTLDTVDWTSPDSAAKLALNPLAKVPALIADGKLIADSRV
jgi:glutathione S-transferase